MRACPRCSVPMAVHRRAFAEVDVCPTCHGIFMDAGEGVAVHGVEAEPSFLLSDGKAAKKGTSDLLCPAHGVIGEASDAIVRISPSAPRMQVYVIGEDEDKIEIDYCGKCGGFYFDAGEGVALLELANRAERIIESRSGAQFAAPPGDRQAEVIDEVRKTQGRSLFAEMVKGMIHGRRRYRGDRRRRGIVGREYRDADYDSLYDDWS